MVLGNLHNDRCSFGFGASLEVDISLIGCLSMQNENRDYSLLDYIVLPLLFEVMVIIMIR